MIVVEDSGMEMPTGSSHRTPRWVLNGLYEEYQHTDRIMYSPQYQLFQHDGADTVFYQADCCG